MTRGRYVSGEDIIRVNRLAQEQKERIVALEAAARDVAFHTLAITQPGERGGRWCCVCGENAHRTDCPVGKLAALLGPG